MNLVELIARISDFASWKPREKIVLFAWFLHDQHNVDIVDNASIRECFKEISATDPNVARELPRMADKKPPDLIRVRGGYKLEGSLRRALNAKYGLLPSTVIVTALLSDLPNKIPELSERAFLSEAIDCYKIKAYRAAIVMSWNLAFDHLLHWIAKDQKRLQDFNAAITKRFPAMKGQTISSISDFEEFKESEVIEVCRTANLLTKNVVEILRDKLKRRNIAAHPSQVTVEQPQADDVITDLVNNVVLALS
jgi:hypothetical protein